jgi:hypothetical protein
MSNFIADNSEAPWTPTEVVEQESEQQEGGLARWWYGWTTPARPPLNASYVRREADRKARLLSVVAFFFLLTMAVFFYPSLYMPSITPMAVVFAALSALIALFVNRAGRTTLGGIIMVVGSEIALTSVILGISPFPVVDIQLYDLYVIIILLAVTLLPARYIFLFALAHSAFIGINIYLVLARDLLTQFIPAIARPIGLQIMVASVAYIWVRSATRAIERANRAEMVASLEHTIAEQRAFIEHEKRDLEESIQQLIRAHVDAANGQLTSRVSYPPAKALWPLVGAMNSLWARLQRTQQVEGELQQLRQAIAYYIQLIQKSSASGQGTLPLVRTGTSLDQLILAMKALHSTSRHDNEG